MSIKDTINEDMKAAMRSRDAARLSTIRMLLAAVKQKEIDERKPVTDPDVVGIVDKMIKQRRESIGQFEAGGRSDLAAAEKAEIEVLQTYLPQPLSQAEIDTLVAEAIAEAGTGGMAAMGKVMAALRPRIAGRADMAEVSARVKAKLTG